MMRAFLGLLAACALVASTPAQEAPNVQSDILDGSVLRYRVATVTDDLTAQLAHLPATTNHLAGFVLDLRFAGGKGLADADTAGFSFFSTNKTPLVVLVNRRTGGAASALATRLRAAGRSIVIGTPQAIPAPDLTVTVTSEAEIRWQANPYLTLTNSPAVSPRGPPAVSQNADTNDWSAFVDHTSEADLVRKKVKDGEDDDELDNRPRSSGPPVIQDPALARAVDLLKALAALHPARG